MFTLLCLVNEARGFLHQTFTKMRCEASLEELRSVRKQREALVDQVEQLQEAIEEVKDSYDAVLQTITKLQQEISMERNTVMKDAECLIRSRTIEIYQLRMQIEALSKA